MNRLSQALSRLSSELADLGVEWALVGGLAVSARGEPRFTRDIDAAVVVADDQGAEQLLHELQQRGYSVVTVIEQPGVGRLATARLSSPGESGRGVVVDLLFASSGIEPEVVASADSLEVFPGVVVPIAAPGTLVALKLLARDDEQRPQDSMDLRALLQVCTHGDLAIARASLERIERRGYHRGRALVQALEKLLSSTEAP